MPTATALQPDVLLPRRLVAPLTSAERWALRIAGGGLVFFAAYGSVTGAPSTLGYLATVVIVGVGIWRCRTRPLPPVLALGLGVLAVGHLAGGLISVGGDALYNAHPRIHALQYDHVFHAAASALATWLLWSWLDDEVPAGRLTVVMAALAAFGVGMLNELVEFVATLAHNGTHVGGYLNTGWDLVADTVGVIAATVALRRGRRRRIR
jgi:hypothetical protein